MGWVRITRKWVKRIASLHSTVCVKHTVSVLWRVSGNEIVCSTRRDVERSKVTTHYSAGDADVVDHDLMR
jgi:hypothetical protein